MPRLDKDTLLNYSPISNINISNILFSTVLKIILHLLLTSILSNLPIESTTPPILLSSLPMTTYTTLSIMVHLHAPSFSWPQGSGPRKTRRQLEENYNSVPQWLPTSCAGSHSLGWAGRAITKFTYIGASITTLCRSHPEITRRLDMARDAMQDLACIWGCRMALQVKVRL